VDDPEAGFEEWYRSEHSRLVTAMLLLSGNVDEAREATDEAFTRALSDWSRVGAMASPGGWTYRVALNVLRRRARRAAIERRLLNRKATATSALPPSALGVWEMVRQLPTRQREVLVLRYAADLTEAAVAQVLGISRSTVSSTLRDAHRRLSDVYVEDQNEVPHA
jgi:RNA polymerase sigma-70 factor (ECF subfamily)